MQVVVPAVQSVHAGNHPVDGPLKAADGSEAGHRFDETEQARVVEEHEQAAVLPRDRRGRDRSPADRDGRARARRTARRRPSSPQRRIAPVREIPEATPRAAARTPRPADPFRQGTRRTVPTASAESRKPVAGQIGGDRPPHRPSDSSRSGTRRRATGTRRTMAASAATSRRAVTRSLRIEVERRLQQLDVGLAAGQRVDTAGPARRSIT